MKAGKLRGLAAGVAIAAAAALLLEGGARVWTTAMADWRENRPEEGFVDSPELGWKLQPGTSYENRRVDPSGLLEADVRQLDRADKVLVISDSTGFGFGVDSAETWAEVLERSLPDVAVINLAVPGYSSEQGRRVAGAEVARLHPRVVVVSFNFNDRRLSPEPDGTQRFERMYRAHRARRIHWHFVDALAGSPAPPVSVRLAEARPRVDPEAYRRNLTEIARQARSAGAQVIFLVLSDNPDEGRWLQKGHEQLEAGKLEDAIASLTRSLASERYKALAKRWLAEAHRRAGHLDHPSLSATVNPSGAAHGDWPFYFDWEYSTVMRAVAAAEGARVVDGAEVLNRDPTVYLDLCHFSAAGHQRIAAALRPSVAEALGR